MSTRAPGLGTEPRMMVRPQAEVPRPVLAKSLQSAQPRSFVHLDSKGQVRSPEAYHRRETAGYAVAFAAALAVPVFYAALWGPTLGLVAGALFTTWTVGRIWQAQLMRHAAQMVMHDRLEEAERILAPMVLSRWTPRGMRGLASLNLGALEARRGQHEKALVHQDAALVFFGKGGRHSVYARMVRYARVQTLVNLGRVLDAQRAILDEKMPQGDYLQVLHWSAELYVALAQEQHALDEDELHLRAKAALGITTAVALLGLIAWAHHQRGDREQAWHLLREAFDREPGHPLHLTMPLLHRWMQEHRVEAGAGPAADTATRP